MTTRPTLDTTPEDASLARFTRDVEKFVEELVGDERVPSAPLDIKVTSQENSVKVTWRAVNEVGVSEYEIFRGTEKNFSGDKSELIATVTQAINPEGTNLVYIDAEATEKSFYFVRAVKGLRRPKIAGPVAGFGTSVSGGSIGEGSVGGSIPGFTGISGSMLFVNDDLKIDQDNDNLFYSHPFKAMVVGPRGLMWGPHASPDVVLLRDASDTLAMQRGTTPQAFRVYETTVGGGSGPAITATRLTSGASEPDATVFTTASVSPGSNKLVLAIVNGLRLAVSPNSAPTAAGNGLTWVQVATVAYEHAGGETGRTRMSVFRAMGVSPSSGAISFTFPETQARASWSIIEFDNIDTGGVDGASAIIQAVISAEATTQTPLATLAAFGSAVNATFGTTGWAAGNPSVTPGTGFVELSEDDLPPNGTGVQTQFRNDNDTTVDVTYGSSVRTVIFGIEIANASQPGGGIFLELDGLGATGEAEVMVDDSSVGTRDLVIGTRVNAGDLRFYNAGVERSRVMTTSGLNLGTNFLSFGASVGTEDVILRREAAGILSLVDPGSNIASGTQQEFRIYSYDFTGETRYLELVADRSGNGEAEIMAVRAEGGGQYDLLLGVVVGGIEFWNENVERWKLHGSVTGAFEIAPTVTNLYDLGRSDSSVRNVYTNGVIIGLDQTAAYDAITIDGTDLVGDGQQDSGAIIMTGLGFESATPHDADWKIFADITTNAAASTWTLQTRIDAASFVSRMTIQDTGLMSVFGNVLLPAADLGNDVPGRCVAVERNTHVADAGPAPGSVELEAADGVSLFLWSDDDGDIRVHTAKATGSTGTPTVDANTAGFKISPLERAHFHFASRIGSFGVEFAAGGYTFSTTDANLTQASATVTIGTANHPYYAHAFLVAAAAGAASGGAGLVEIEVSGTSVDDNGVRTAADTEVLVADITAMATNQYFETTKKWIGTVTWTLQVAGGGTHTTFNADFNYGLAKYEDFGNMDFEITGLELTGRAGAADTGFNVELCEHRATGWTYAATGFVAGLGTALVDVAGILSTESDLAAGEEFAFKKLNVSSQIAGSVAEGYILRITTGANAAVETMNITVTVRLN